MNPEAAPVPISRIVEPAMRVNALFQIALGLSMDNASGLDRSGACR